MDHERWKEPLGDMPLQVEIWMSHPTLDALNEELARLR